MMMQDERLLELLADRATGDLDDVQTLNGLLREHPDMDDDSMDLAATSAMLAYLTDEEAMPAGLMQKIQGDADAYYGQNVVQMPQRPAADEPQAAQPTPSGSGFAWLLTAAAMVVAVIGWWPTEPTEVMVTPPPPVELTLAQQLEALRSDAADVTTYSFGATDDAYAAGAGGSVVWSNARQEGFMTISGLHVNNPSEDQYQLWIFDKNRNQDFPVDGGVFDVNAEGEVIIPIDARLAVAEPALFAVTVERPGGVVVSSRERIVLAAAVN